MTSGRTFRDPAPQTEAAVRWARDLAGWGIPDEILRNAQANPWGWPRSRLRRVRAEDAPTRRAACAGLGDGGTLLDVGVGAGWSSLDLVPPATRLIGVDSDPEMLAAFATNCRERDIAHEAVEGHWPEVASGLEVVDVVVCAHVVYNVAAIVPFLRALTAQAGRRVVLECSARHPTAWMTPLWQRFHGLQRPERPTADDLIEVLGACGVAPQVERWQAPPPAGAAADAMERAEFVTRRLCLPAGRVGEVEEALRSVPSDGENLTIWWEPD